MYNRKCDLELNWWGGVLSVQEGGDVEDAGCVEDGMEDGEGVRWWTCWMWNW